MHKHASHGHRTRHAIDVGCVIAKHRAFAHDDPHDGKEHFEDYDWEPHHRIYGPIDYHGCMVIGCVEFESTTFCMSSPQIEDLCMDGCDDEASSSNSRISEYTLRRKIRERWWLFTKTRM